MTRMTAGWRTKWNYFSWSLQ